MQLSFSRSYFHEREVSCLRGLKVVNGGSSKKSSLSKHSLNA
jgi:hypothetical protein